MQTLYNPQTMPNSWPLPVECVSSGKEVSYFLLRVNQQFLKLPSVQTCVAVLPEVSQYQNVTVPEYFEEKSTVEARSRRFG